MMCSEGGWVADLAIHPLFASVLYPSPGLQGERDLASAMNFKSACFLGLVLLLQPARTTSAQTIEPWRAAAHERIEQHRKGTFRFVVTDEQGVPVAGAPVHVRMKRHQFGWGTTVNSTLLADTQWNPNYRQKLNPTAGGLTGDGRTFNLAVFENEMKWRYWENASNTVKNTRLTQVAWMRNNGMDVRGHVLAWGDQSTWPNDFAASDSLEFLKQRIEGHIKALAGRQGVRGVLREWDVLNEPVNVLHLRDKFRGRPGYPTGEEIYDEIFRWAHEADPDAKLYINEYNTVNGAGTSWGNSVRDRYLTLIRRLIDNGVPINGIGLQGHVSPTHAPSMPNLLVALDAYAATGLRIAITEYDYTDPSCAIKANEQMAANYLRDFLTMIYSHRSVDSFTMWGFWDQAHWRCDSPMYRENWTLKPSGEVFIDLVFNTWWTDETVQTDANGIAEVRGFLGTYEIEAEVPAGRVAVTSDLGSSAGKTITIRGTATNLTDFTERATGVRLHANYPNPFNPQTTIVFEVPAHGPVALRVFNALGQEVRTLVDDNRPAGRHEVVFEADGLPSGPYVYEIRAGEQVERRMMMLVR
jgi:endo-1,4-beta-xylanase